MSTNAPKVAPPTKKLRNRVLEYVNKVGFGAAVKELGISKEALKNLLAEQPVRVGTIAVVEKNLPATA